MIDASNSTSGGFREISREEVRSPSMPAIRPYRAFPTKALPAPLARFVREAAHSLGCDEALVALPQLSVLASFIGNARRLRIKNDWHEPSILWTAPVAKSGTLKSPAMELALTLARRIQSGYLQDFEVAQRDYAREIARHEAQKKGRQDNPSGDPPEEPPVMPKLKRLTCSDTTVEALAELLRDNRRGLLLECEELSGWIGSFDAYRKGYGGDVSKWLTMHAGRSLTVDRKRDGLIVVPRAAVSITGGIQPDVLRRVFGREHLENGLAPRFLFAMPPRLRRRWTSAQITARAWSEMERISRTLLSLDCDDGRSCSLAPKALTFSPAAEKRWIDFYNEWAEIQEGSAGVLAAAYAKLEGYTARLALIVHLVRWASGELGDSAPESVDEPSLAAGIGLVRWFGHEAERIYAYLGASDQERQHSSLVELIRQRGGRIRPRDLMHACRRFRGSAEDAKSALESLAEAGLGKLIPCPPSAKGGRPTLEFVLGLGNETLGLSQENRVSLPLPPLEGNQQVLSDDISLACGKSSAARTSLERDSSEDSSEQEELPSQ